MKRTRSGRAWLPAAVVAAVFTLTLIVLQAIFRLAYDDSVIPTEPDDSTLEWLLVTNLGFWGPGAFETDQSRVIVANLVAAAVLLVVAFMVAWLALRGMAPGSSALSAFLGAWAATMVAAPVAAVTNVLVRDYDRLDDALLGPSLSSAVSTSVYGFKWGWIAALLATLVWLAVRPRPEISPEPIPPADPEPTTTPYPGPPA